MSEDLPPDVALQIEAAEIIPGAPLLVVDVDEVIVHFADGFADWLTARGMTLTLDSYRLNGAVRHANGAAVEAEATQTLIGDYIREETRRQRAVVGAVEALTRLSADWSVLILTNAPMSVREDRILNLADHGVTAPVVMNTGGKGRAVARMAAMAVAPVAFIDDSPIQHECVAKHAPEACRIQFIGSEIVRAVAPASPHARAVPDDWAGVEAALAAWRRGG